MAHRFESLLAIQLALVAGCNFSPSNTDGKDRDPPKGEDYCAGDELPDTGTVLSVGFLAIEPGGVCPEVTDITTLSHENCCPVHEFVGQVCSFEGRSDGMVATGYYGGWSAGTGPESKDLCLYEGVFEVGNACCGRPLLRDAEPVVAPVRREADWSADLRPDVHALSAEARRIEGEHWLRSALLEHASVASFARFSLELLRFGAPPDLLSGAQRAGLDEVEHARLCFAVASAYLDQPLGPDAMDLSGAAVLAADLASFAEALVREGCVGETLAAFDAAARLAHTTDPVVRGVLQTIIDDESRHAALAWRTLRWVLARDSDGGIRERLEGVFADEASRWGASVGWDRVIEPAWAGLP